ncbi:MAG: PAS domain S-box protein [Spirochaetales bacterium]|nr:PAS domain S-box protein [Spirochaetales bacterium]
MTIQLENMRTGTRLVLGLSLVIVVFLIIGWLTFFNLNTMFSYTEGLYRHPYAVSTASLRLQRDIIAMHRSMKDVVLALNVESINDTRIIVDEYEQSVYKEFDIILERFLGDKKKVESARQHFVEWKPIRDEVTFLMLAGEREQAAAITRGRGAQHLHLLLTNVQWIVDYAENRAQNFQDKAAESKKNFMMFVSIGILCSLFLAVFIYWTIAGLKRAEKDLKAYRNRLEETVAERTQEFLTTNINLRKEIQERLRAEETLRHFQYIVSNTTDMMALRDTNLTYLAANTAYFNALGLTAAEIIGFKDFEIFGEEFTSITIKPHADRCLAGEEVHYQDWFDFPVTGRSFMDVAYFPCFNNLDKVEGFVIVARNITDQKKADEERDKLRVQVIQSQRLASVGTLARGVAHEINNPINGILNYAQLIKDSIDIGSREYEFASEIIVETERVAGIVQNLLTFAQQDMQAHSLARMTDIIKGATSLIQTINRGDMIKLELDVPDDLPKLKCRSQQIQQVIMNLLTNARDALNERYKEYDEDKIIRIYVRTIEKEGRRWIRITVEDHGTGISADVRERIFDPFYTTKGRTEGTGLGLSISHGIVVDHYGELTVESVPNEYTRFHLDLPINDEDE